MFAKWGQKAQEQAPAAASNKREFFRLQLRMPIQLQTGILSIPALLVDLSGGGCQVYSRVQVEAKAVKFKLKRTDGMSEIELGGLIKGKGFLEKERVFVYGIAFEGLSERTQQALVQEIAMIERRERLKAQEAAKAVPKPQNANGRHERSAFRVAWPFKMTFSIVGKPGTMQAQALDISVGGMRMSSDQLLKDESKIELQFTLPDKVLDVLTTSETVGKSELFGARFAAEKKVVKQKPFPPMRLHAMVRPGKVTERGKFTYGLAFEDADPMIREEIQRFVHAAQLMKRKMGI